MQQHTCSRLSGKSNVHVMVGKSGKTKKGGSLEGRVRREQTGSVFLMLNNTRTVNALCAHTQLTEPLLWSWFSWRGK